MVVLKGTLLVLLCYFLKYSYSKSSEIDVCSIWSNNWRHSPNLKDLVIADVRPAAGQNSGKYSKVQVDSWTECVEKCCQFHRCNVAYWIKSSCLHIECISDESCQPLDQPRSEEEVFYLKVRSVRSTAAAIDYDDPGHDECNDTMPCGPYEECEQVSINADIKRNVCLCDRDDNFRRINGVCRQFLPRTRPCALYATDTDDDDNDVNPNSGACKKDEECLPPTDRAKHGYCQCKLGYIRKNSSKRCMPENQESPSTEPSVTTEVTSISLSSDFEVQAGDDQIVTLPKTEIDLYGRILYKSNKSEVDISVLDGSGLKLVWSLKSSTNGVNVALDTQPDLASHAIVKQLQQGIYEFELKLNRGQETTIASDIVKVNVVEAQTEKVPLSVQVTTSIVAHLPQQVTKIESRVEPSNQEVTYQWTYLNDGPANPTFENANAADLIISDLRPGNYSIQLDVANKDGKHETRVIHLFAVGKPIQARVLQLREIVFWPSNDVILDGTQSVIEKQTRIYWKLLSTDNGQEANSVDILSPHALKTRISNLRIGQYTFELALVTYDKKYTSKEEVVVVVYAQNGRPPNVLIRVVTNHVNILNNLIVLNASETTADYGITKWIWSKSPSSPARGHFIDNSQFSSIAYIADLVEGKYTFILQVFDDRKQMTEANITIYVDNVPDRENLIEIKFAPKQYLYQQALDNLLAQIRVFLLDILPSIEIDMAGILRGSSLLIKGIDPKTNLIVSPKTIADHLRKKLKSLRSASNLAITSIDTFLCLSNCSGHGKCDHETKHCVCDKFFMENWYKSIIRKEPNCDFKIQYFIPIAIATSIATIVFCCLLFCCCLRWKRRYFLLERRRRIRYRLLNDDDDNENEDAYGNDDGIIKIKTPNKKKVKASRRVTSESDDLSDENGEQTLYDKPLLTSKQHSKPQTKKGSALKVSVQDTNGSAVTQDNRPASVTPEQSVA